MEVNTSMFRKCYEPHLRDYPDCYQECGLDHCEAPIFSEKQGVECGNCGVHREIYYGMVEKCPNCKDDEYEYKGE
jgi:hypothetical protein